MILLVDSGGLQFKARLCKHFLRPLPKITTRKETGGVAQGVECLLCQHKALSSNPSPTKKKKNTTTKHLEKQAPNWFFLFVWQY
jgi:hypothetical protein